jgi:hypothetical protein
MPLLARAALVAASLFLLAPSPAAADWREPVGGAGGIFTDPGRFGAAPSIAGVNGVPYVAWHEAGDIRLARLDADNTRWEEVVGAASAYNAAPGHDGQFVSLAAAGGVLYAAWLDSVDEASFFEVRVARLAADGRDWEPVAGPVGTTSVHDQPPELAIVDGVPHVAWVQALGALDHDLRVVRLDATGTGWELVGSGPVSGESGEASLADVGGIPYVAWTRERELHVSRLATGGGWEPVGAPVDPAGGELTTRPTLSSIDGVPYVAWSAFGSRVARLDPGGSRWLRVGGPDEAPGRHGRLLVIDDVPYLAYGQGRMEWGIALGLARAARDESGWDPVGGVVNAANPSSPTVDVNMRFDAVDIAGIPHVAWQANGRARVARLEPDLLSATALPTQTGATLAAEVRTFGLRYPIGFELGSAFERATTLTAAVRDPDTIVKQVDGLTPGTAYRYRAVTRIGASPLLAFGGPASFSTTPADAPPRLLIAALRDSQTVRRGRSVRLSYLLTAPAAVVLEVRRGSRVVARKSYAGRAGRNTVSWNGRIGRSAAPAGKYRLVLRATGGDGQRAADGSTVRLVRRIR